MRSEAKQTSPSVALGTLRRSDARFRDHALVRMPPAYNQYDCRSYTRRPPLLAQNLCRTPTRSETCLSVADGVNPVICATAGCPSESVPLAFSNTATVYTSVRFDRK